MSNPPISSGSHCCYNFSIPTYPPTLSVARYIFLQLKEPWNVSVLIGGLFTLIKQGFLQTSFPKELSQTISSNSKWPNFPATWTAPVQSSPLLAVVLCCLPAAVEQLWWRHPSGMLLGLHGRQLFRNLWSPSNVVEQVECYSLTIGQPQIIFQTFILCAQQR